MTERRAEAALLGVSLVWGATFVMVKEAVAVVDPLAFIALRFALAALALAPWALAERPPPGTRHGGWAPAPAALLGAFVAAGYVLQTVGLRHTTSSRAGFITGLSVVLVPLVAWAWHRSAPTRREWLGAGLAVAGLGLLASPGATGAAAPQQALGDLLVLGCAVAYAAQIVAVGVLAPGAAALRLALGQIVVAGLLAAAAALALGRLGAPWSGQAVGAAAFTGVFATAVAFGVQIVAQRRVAPARAALIFASEPVFAAVFGMALAGDRLRAAGWVGGALVVTAMGLGGRAAADDGALPRS